MIPARADVSVCPVFCVCVPVSVRRNARFFVYYLSDKIGLFVHFLIFSRKNGIYFIFMETIPIFFRLLLYRAAPRSPRTAGP